MTKGAVRVCSRCRKETDKMFCPTCRVLTYPPKEEGAPPTSVLGEMFECTVWQGPNRARGIEVDRQDRDKFFSREHEMVVLHIDGTRTIAKLGSGFWRKPAVIRKAVREDGKDQLGKFMEKHHLLPPDQSIKEKGIVDTIVFEVLSPAEEFRISLVERMQGTAEDDANG